jgi:hypothetical protein
MYPATQPRPLAYSRHTESGSLELGTIEAPDNPNIVAMSVVPINERSKKGISIRALRDEITASFGLKPEALSAQQ